MGASPMVEVDSSGTLPAGPSYGFAAPSHTYQPLFARKSATASMRNWQWNLTYHSEISATRRLFLISDGGFEAGGTYFVDRRAINMDSFYRMVWRFVRQSGAKGRQACGSVRGFRRKWQSIYYRNVIFGSGKRPTRQASRNETNGRRHRPVVMIRRQEYS
jgi:hypothetical protein